jgi:hypothetical protein
MRGTSIALLVLSMIVVTATRAVPAGDGGQAATLVLGGFSSMPTGSDFGAWRVTELPSVSPSRFRIVDADGTTVARIDSAAAAASLIRPVDESESGHRMLHWRWRVDRVISAGDLASRGGDDFAARLYVMFDYPSDQLPLLARAKLNVARWLYGDDVPAAALCYVWGNHETVGTEAWSAYTDRVRVIVLRNRGDAIGDWVSERRDIIDDYLRAFGGQPVPVSGLAIAADTDQTGERVTAWFGDISLGR